METNIEQNIREKLLEERENGILAALKISTMDLVETVNATLSKLKGRDVFVKTDVPGAVDEQMDAIRYANKNSIPTRYWRIIGEAIVSYYWDERRKIEQK